MKPWVGFFVAFVGTILVSSPAIAQRKDLQSGEIAFEEDAPVRNPLIVAKEEALAFAGSLELKIAELAHGGSSAATVPTDAALNHLAPAYLYCAVNQGTCPFILDSILEADLINARLSKSEACPSMSKFWRLWMGNDYENRHKYMVKTGFLTETSDFRTKTRPRYIQCKTTIKAETASAGSDADFFKKRYADGKILAAAKKTNAFLKELAEKVPNVLHAVTSGSK